MKTDTQVWTKVWEQGTRMGAPGVCLARFPGWSFLLWNRAALGAIHHIIGPPRCGSVLCTPPLASHGPVCTSCVPCLRTSALLSAEQRHTHGCCKGRVKRAWPGHCSSSVHSSVSYSPAWPTGIPVFWRKENINPGWLRTHCGAQTSLNS